MSHFSITHDRTIFFRQKSATAELSIIEEDIAQSPMLSALLLFVGLCALA
jgi:hypothetical protein